MITLKFKYAIILLFTGIILCGAQTAEDYEKAGFKKFGDSDYTGAVTDLNKAIEIDPGYAYAYFGLGWAYYYLGRYEQSGTNLVKAFTLDPNAYTFINYSNAGFYCLKHKQYESSAAIYSLAVNLFPKSENFHTRLGVDFLYLHQLDSAISHFKKVTEFSPFYSDAWYYLGLTDYLQNQYEKAIERFDKAEKWHPYSEELLWRRGFAYLHLKLYDISLVDFRKSAKENDTLFMPYLGIAAVYMQLNDMNNAKSYFDKAVSLEPLLKEGLDGIKKPEDDGYFFNDDDKEVLGKLFDKIK